MKRQQEKKHSMSTQVVGMGGSYALGTFTDNFYKQAAVLLAASAGMTEMQSVATVLFSLPFIICSAWAGWIADRFVKKKIVVAAKSTELLALGIGAFSLYFAFWPGILLVVFLMGLQSTMFSPALNGSIPEVFPVSHVPKVNSYIKLASTIAVLAGITAAGFFMDVRPGGGLPTFGLAGGEAYGRAVCGVVIVGASLIGFLSALPLASRPAAVPRDSRGAFPWSGPAASLRQFFACRKDPQLFLVLLAEGFFYGVAAIAVICVANLADALGYSKTLASLLSASIMIGIALGAVIAGRFDAYSWRRLLLPAAIGMGLFVALISLTPLFAPEPFTLFSWLPGARLLWFFVMLFLAGVCGGIYLIPVASFIQVRPPAEEKGKILGISNFFSFVAIAIFGVLFYPMGYLPPQWTFLSFGLLLVLFALVYLRPRIRSFCDSSLEDAASSFLGSSLKVLLSLRYRIKEKGLDALEPVCAQGEKVTARPILFLPNHPALIDPFIVYSRIAGLRPRALADSGQVNGWKKFVARLFHMVTIPDMQKDGKQGVEGVKAAIEAVGEALRSGDHALLYPAGRAYRSAREELGGNSAVHYLLSTVPGLRVVLVRTTGLWGSSFSYAGGKTPHVVGGLLKKVPVLFANLFFFIPKRQVTIEFAEVEDMPGEKMALNRFLESFYNEKILPAKAVPLYFWQGSAPRVLPEPEATAQRVDEAAFSPELTGKVYGILRDQAGLDAEIAVTAASRLGGDLGMDSLDVMEAAARIEEEFGVTIPSLEGMVTAGDCLSAASGASTDNEQRRQTPVEWFDAESGPEAKRAVCLPPGCPSIVHAFLRQVRDNPSRPLLTDGTSLISRRKALIAALILAEHFRSLPGERIGVMLPATPAAVLVWLGMQLAEKVPVMLNWTVGEKNFRSCLGAAGLQTVVTAKALLEQLQKQGVGLPLFEKEELAAKEGKSDAAYVLLLERIFASVTKAAKVRCALKAWLFSLTGRGLALAGVPETAVVLFTSGSEARPKGVPLSHANILANAKDVLGMLGVRNRESILAMLPPFHSFGMLVGIALPLSTGVRAAYHPNPTEAFKLCGLVRDYGLTLLGAAPSFLEAMLRSAPEGSLASLRYAFVGAEKCPERVYRAFAAECPQASLCEGYGITECSPVISVNPPSSIKEGSIGFAVPSLSVVLVSPEAGGNGSASGDLEQPDAPECKEGLLLVRGPSVFGGYLGDAPDPFVSFSGHRWYNTGDLVAMDEEGRLTFKGRLKRFVKVGGEMVSLPLMEEVLQQAVEKKGLAASVPADAQGKPLLAVVTVPGTEQEGRPELVLATCLDITAPQANRYLADAGLSALYTIKRVKRMDALPLLGTGKTDYQTLGRIMGVKEESYHK